MGGALLRTERAIQSFCIGIGPAPPFFAATCPHHAFLAPVLGFWLFFYSFIYINSSSSRAALFLWTSLFSSMMKRGYVASKHVGRRAQNAGLADNNLGRGRFCVDNYPVVPELFPGLSTNWCVATATHAEKPGVHQRTPGFVWLGSVEGACRHQRTGCLPVWLADWLTGLVRQALRACLRRPRACHGGRDGLPHRHRHHASCRPCGDHRGGPWRQRSFAARASGPRRKSW